MLVGNFFERWISGWPVLLSNANRVLVRNVWVGGEVYSSIVVSGYFLEHFLVTEGPRVCHFMLQTS